MGSIKPHEKNRKVLRALNWLHTLKSLKNKNNYMARITTYLTILRVNVNGLNFPIKRYHLANWIKKEDLTICLQETHCYDRNKHCLRVKGWEKIYQANGPPKQAGVATLKSEKVDFKPKLVRRDKEVTLY
jgi:hypothetical protein